MKKWIPGVVCLLLSVIVFLATGIEPISHTTQIPFNTLSGVGGVIDLQMPDYVITNTSTKVKIKIDFNEDLDSGSPILLTGRFETGIEELSPRGSFEVLVEPEKPFEIEWKIRPEKKAIYPGNLWIFLEQNGRTGLLLSKEIPINSISLFGIDTRIVKVSAGGVGLIGIVLVFFRWRKKELH